MKAVFCPHGTNFFGRRDFTALDFGLCFKQIGLFLGRQLNWWFASHVKIISQQKGPGKTGALEIDERQSRSARIEFDDQMRLHLHRERHVG
jgi:hypothetical protein